MAKQGFIFRSMNQSLMWLKHAERLCNIMQDDQCGDEAIKYMAQIQPLQNEYGIYHERERNEGPTLPKRESMLEPTQKLRTRNVKQVTIKEEVDPYTNISSSFTPQDFDDEIEEEMTAAVSRKKSVVLRKKSVGFSTHHMPSSSFTPQNFDDEIEEETVFRKKSIMQRRKSIVTGHQTQNGSAMKNLEIHTKVQIHSNGISDSNNNNVEEEFDLNALLGNSNGSKKMTNGKVNRMDSIKNYDSDEDCDTTF